jgi:integrating conjugative element protein (TIGR03759 family)
MSIRPLTLISLLVALVFTKASAIDVETSQSTTSAISTSRIDTTDQRRLQWNLSDTEWQRYQTLMQGVRGSISPATISPLEVLAMHAETAQKRRHYARLWAKLYHDDVERTLKFQAAYNTAWDELYGNQPMVDVSKLNLKVPVPETWTNTDRIALFVKIQTCPRCQHVVYQAAKRALKAGATLDLYFVATQPGRDDDLIRHWAQAASIDPKHVKAKRITLNHEDGELMRFTGTVVTQFPLAFQIKPNSIRQIQIDHLE